MNIIHTNLSCWQAARVAASKLADAIDWVGIDSAGDVIAGTGEPTNAAIVVVSGDKLAELRGGLVRANTSREFQQESGQGRSTDEIDALAALVERFELHAQQIGPDPARFEPTVGYFLGGPAATDVTKVHYAAPNPRDRVEAHVARGCTHCRRPRYASPEQPARWDCVAAWQRRWEATGLSAAEAALWTDLVGCRPDIAIELRASGLTAERLQRAIVELPTDTCEDLTAKVDDLLLWIRSAYSWQELETTGSWHLGTRDLVVERELRARGFDAEASCREIEVAGAQVPLAEFLEDDALGNGRPMLLSEKLEWLEQTGRVPNWSAALA